MSVRMRHTSSHTKNRRSHHALENMNIVTDKESGALRLPHRIDETTGVYRGKQIVTKKEVKAKGKKKAARTHKHEDVKSGPNTNKSPEKHTKNEEREKKQSKNVLGNLMKGRSTTRSGFGGGV